MNFSFLRLKFLSGVQDEDELGGSILDRNNEAKAMLKIAGRELLSEGFMEMDRHEWDNWILWVAFLNPVWYTCFFWEKEINWFVTKKLFPSFFLFVFSNYLFVFLFTFAGTMSLHLIWGLIYETVQIIVGILSSATQVSASSTFSTNSRCSNHSSPQHLKRLSHFNIFRCRFDTRDYPL